MDSGRIKDLLEEKKDGATPSEAPSALPVLVTMESRDLNEDTYSKLLSYYGYSSSYPHIADSILCLLQLHKKPFVREFAYFDLHSGSLSTGKVDLSKKAILIGDKIIDFGSIPCNIFQINKDRVKLGELKLAADISADSINRDSACLSPDQQCVALIADYQTIVIVDLKNYRGFSFQTKEGEPLGLYSIGAMMFERNDELIVFFNGTKGRPKERCARYQLDLIKQKASKPEEIALDFDYQNILVAKKLSGDRIVVIASALEYKPPYFMTDVNVCALTGNTIKFTKEVGKSSGYKERAPLGIFDSGNILVFQDYATNELKVVMGEHIFTCYSLNQLKNIILSGPNVGCLVFANNHRGVCEVDFLKLPMLNLVNTKLAEALPRFSRDVVGIVSDYLGPWVDADSALPIYGGKTQALSVSNVMVLGRPFMSDIIPKGIAHFAKGTVTPINENDILYPLDLTDRWQQVKSIAQLNEILNELLLLLDEYLKIVEHGVPEPESIKCRNDLQTIIKSLNASSGSFLKLLQQILNKYQGRVFGVYLVAFGRKAELFPEIVAREEIENQFESDMAKVTKFPRLSSHPATNQMILTQHLEIFSDEIKKLDVRPRILLERMINWVKVCEKLQRREDVKDDIIRTSPLSSESKQLTKVLNELEALRKKGEAVTLNEIYGVFSQLTSLKKYSVDIQGKIIDLTNSLGPDVDAEAKILAQKAQAKALADAHAHALALALAVAQAAAEVTQPDEKKSATTEAELEKCFKKIEENQATLDAEELFLPVYQWFKYGVTFVGLKYNEAKSSGDAKVISPADTFKRKIDTALPKITTYTTSKDKTAGLKAMKEILEDLMKDDSGCPELLKQHIKKVIAILEPHVPKPDATPVAKP